ncbi:MAG TPA: nucleotidyltransferase domain-containing protein [Solirubrobacteraceae bacterium]|jgi:predicted nucleotidyltransferase|nr:nucleotidyltransferase domain-containing protein [Solirubrobacteraceae bacterium]
MRSLLPRLAADLGADERTLRRAARRGTVRCRRPGPRQLELEAGELDYLRSHWGLLRELTQALRTERNVRLAILYGSSARGDDLRDSDLDLLVDLRARAPGATSAVAVRVERALGRHVDVADLGRVERDAPLLLLYALDEGRVLIDRDAQWPTLLARRGEVARAAQRAERTERRAVAESWRMLVDHA